jgi:hypothetical protein
MTPPGHGLVDLQDPECVRAWVDSLDISREDLFRAVSAVGNSPHDVWRYVTEEE